VDNSKVTIYLCTQKCNVTDCLVGHWVLLEYPPKGRVTLCMCVYIHPAHGKAKRRAPDNRVVNSQVT